MKYENTQPNTSLKSIKLFTFSYCSILVANFLLLFGFWLLVPLLPFYLQDYYSLTESSMGAILASYTISALIVRPFSAYILDTFSRKPLYIVAFSIFTSIFCGYIWGGTLTLFIILRIIHGFAFGTVTVAGNTFVIDIMPSERRGEGLGYYGLTNNFAMCLGPMVGLSLLHYISYEWIFGIGFLTCFTGLILALFIKSPTQVITGKKSPFSLDRFFLLKSVPASISLLLLSIPYGATTNFVAMYVEEIGIPVQSALYFTIMAIGMGVSRIFSGKFVDKGLVTKCIHYGYYLAIIAFLLLGFCKFILLWNGTLCIICFLLVPMLQGVGFGIIFPAYNTLYINLAANNQRATATSSYLTSWDVGLGLGIILSGWIAELYNFSVVYLLGGVLSLVSMSFFDYVVVPHYNSNKLR